MCDLISNLRKTGQKLRSLSKAIGTSDGQTNTQVILYLSNAMNCIGQTIKLINAHNVSKCRIWGAKRGSKGLRCRRKVSEQLQERRAGGREFQILEDVTEKLRVPNVVRANRNTNTRGMDTCSIDHNTKEGRTRRVRLLLNNYSITEVKYDDGSTGKTKTAHVTSSMRTASKVPSRCAGLAVAADGFATSPPPNYSCRCRSIAADKQPAGAGGVTNDTCCSL